MQGVAHVQWWAALFVCTGLGLDGWRDDRLHTAVGKSPLPLTSVVGSGKAAAKEAGLLDPEAGLSRTGKPRPSLPRAVAVATATARVMPLVGVVPLRVILLVAYLAVLHLSVMVSFTSRTSSTGCACGGQADAVLAVSMDKSLP